MSTRADQAKRYPGSVMVLLVESVPFRLAEPKDSQSLAG